MARMTSAATVLALLLSGSAKASGSAPAIDAFRDAFAQIRDYTYTLRSHETLGNRVQDRVLQYWFMKPHFAKTVVVSGDGSGGVAVWNGGDQLSGHQGGLLAFIHLRVGLHDARATSLRGLTVLDALLQNVVGRYADVRGTLRQGDGGEAADRLELDVADPSSDYGITKQVLYLSKSTHLPVRQILYQGEQIVCDQTFADVKTNVGLTQSDFPF